MAYVFCPNHTSYLDIMLIYIAIPVYFHTMGKAELRRVPLFRHFFDRMNIPVNRKSRKDSHRAFLRAASDIEKKISITLFPEGTIHHTGPVMGRFKNGPFKLAVEKQVPIVPITFMNNWLLLPDDFYRRIGHPGIARIILHDPIPTIGMTEDDIDVLKENPALALPILAPLKSDTSKYVQDSVGNWLNDASKTKPDFVYQICEKWSKDSPTKETNYIINKALRTLEK